MNNRISNNVSNVASSIEDYNVDTKTLIQEAEALFTRDEDIKDVSDIKKMQQEVQIQCNSRLRDAKEIIKVMTSLVGKKEGEIVAPSYSDHAAMLKRVSDKENISLQVDSLLRAIDEKKQRIEAIQASTASLLKQSENILAGTTSTVDSRTAYAISLYSKITNITWDYNAPADKIVGYVSDEVKKEVLPFQFDSDLSSFEVSNRLWTLIGQSQQY